MDLHDSENRDSARRPRRDASQQGSTQRSSSGAPAAAGRAGPSQQVSTKASSSQQPASQRRPLMPDLHGEVMQSGNVAVVTGSSSGIGRAVARLCAAKGMHVFLADIDAQMLPEAQAEIDSLASPHGGSATSVVTDVSDPQSVASLRDAVLAAHGTVHLLHCNAGLEVPGGVLEPLSSWERTLGVNLFGVIYAAKAFLEPMMQGGQPGVIVCTGSKQGITM
jgi:hypothetical protein